MLWQSAKTKYNLAKQDFLFWMGPIESIVQVKLACMEIKHYFEYSPYYELCCPCNLRKEPLLPDLSYFGKRIECADKSVSRKMIFQGELLPKINSPSYQRKRVCSRGVDNWLWVLECEEFNYSFSFFDAFMFVLIYIFCSLA